jgi:hypothetical protein
MVRKPGGKGPLGRHKRRWEGNIKMDLRNVEWTGLVWIYLARDRDKYWAFAIAVMNLKVP